MSPEESSTESNEPLLRVTTETDTCSTIPLHGNTHSNQNHWCKKITQCCRTISTPLMIATSLANIGVLSFLIYELIAAEDYAQDIQEDLQDKFNQTHSAFNALEELVPMLKDTLPALSNFMNLTTNFLKCTTDNPQTFFEMLQALADAHTNYCTNC